MSSATVSVCLANHELWDKFYPNTEMLVRKGGRMLFPHLDFIAHGLEAEALYKMEIHFEPIDNMMYKFEMGKWLKKGLHEIRPTLHTEHPKGVRRGEEWMSEKISFSSLKITHIPDETNPEVVLLQTLHKYQPVLTITRIGDEKEIEFRLEKTQFIAVTSYNDPEIIKLKTEHNKYARKRNASGVSEDPKRRCPSTSIPSPPSATPPSTTTFTPPPTPAPWPSPPSLNPHLNFGMPPAPIYQHPNYHSGYNYGYYPQFYQYPQYYPTVPMHAPPPPPALPLPPLPPMLTNPTGMQNQFGHY